MIPFFSTGEIKIINGIKNIAGNYFQNHPHLLSIVTPQSELECLETGAIVFEKIRNKKVQSPIEIQRKIKL